MDQVLHTLTQVLEQGDPQHESLQLWTTLANSLQSANAAASGLDENVAKTIHRLVQRVWTTPEAWHQDGASHLSFEQTVPCQVVRVLCFLGGRGKKDQESIMRLGILPEIVDFYNKKQDLVDAATCCALLQLFQLLACNARHRMPLFHANAIALTLQLMGTHATASKVQALGCKFLQYMAYEEDAKLQIIEKEGLHRVLLAFRSFSHESELAVAGSDLLYFLSLELDSEQAEQDSPSSDANDDDAGSNRQVNSLICQIVDIMMVTMQQHLKQRRVQAQGIAILNNFVSHQCVQELVCRNPQLFTLIAAALDANEEARDDTVDFAATLFTNATAMEHICSNFETNAHMQTTVGQIQSKLGLIRHQLQEKQQAIDLILQNLNALVEYITRLRSATASNDLPSPACSDSSPSEPLLAPLSPVQELQQQDDHRRFLSDPDSEAEEALLELPSEPSPMHRVDSTASTTTTTMSTATTWSAASNSTAVQVERDEDEHHPSNGPLTQHSHLVEPAGDSNHVETVVDPPKPSQSFLSEISRDLENGFFDRFLTVSPRMKLRALGANQLSHGKKASSLSSPPTNAISDQTATLKMSTLTQNSSSRQQQHHHQQHQQHLQESPIMSPSAMAEFQSAFARLQQDQKLLIQHFQIVQRRCQEQAKLLHIQNSRIESQRQTHEQLLARTLLLEKQLGDAQEQMGVEKELRHVEVCQSQKMSQALSHAMREIKALNTQNHDHATQLMQKEKLRLDMQHRHVQLKSQHESLGQEKQTLIQQNTDLVTTNQQLTWQIQEMAREHLESMHMRDQDVNVPSPQQLKQLLTLKNQPLSHRSSHGTTVNGSVHYLSWKNSRAKSPSCRSQPSQFAQYMHQQQLQQHMQSTPTQMVRNNDPIRNTSVSYFAPSTSSAGSMMEPSPPPNVITEAIASRRFSSATVGASNRSQGCEQPTNEPSRPQQQNTKERSMSVVAPVSPDKHKTESFTSKKAVDASVVQQKLRFAFDTLDTSIDSEGNSSGVHIAVVRRFLLECGVVQPPALAASELDLILSKVLKIAFANRKSQHQQLSSFASHSRFLNASPCFATCKSLAPLFTKPNNMDVTRQRFFEFDSFCEALLLVGMKRFPRLEVSTMLEKLAVEFIEPCAQRIRANDCNGTLSSLRNGSSGLGGSNGIRSSGSGSCRRRFSVASANAVTCSSAIKTILNGLLLCQGSSSGANHNNKSAKAQDDKDDPSEFRRPTTTNHGREELLFAMLEMHSVLAREQKAIAAICDFYGAVHATRDAVLVVSFELVLNFALDFEIIPSFMDRLSVKYLYSEVSSLIKSYLAVYNKLPVANDPEMLKKVAFSLILARMAREVFGSKADYETPEKQITGFLQWMDNCAGREKLMRKSLLPIVIRFSSKLYSLKI